MPDNVTIPAQGTGDTTPIVATDQVGTDHYQRVKLTDGTADSSTHIHSGNGTAANSLRVTVASDSTGQIDVTDRALRDCGKIDVVDITGTVSLPTGAATAANQLPDGHNVTVDNAAGAAAVNIQDGGNTITVDGSVTANAGTNLNTSALALEAGNLATIAGDTTAIQTSVELIDDTIATLGTTTYTEATTKAQIAGAVRRDADTTAVNTDNEVAPLLVNAIGALKVEIFDGGDSHTVDGTVAVSSVGGTVTVSATNLDIRDLAAAQDSVTVHGDVGVIDQLDLTNSNPAAVAIVDGNGDQITSFGGGVQYTEGDTDASVTGTAVMWEDAADTLRVASAAKPLPVEVIAGATSGTEYVDDTSTHSTGVTSGFAFLAAATPTDGSVDANDLGVVAMSTDRRLHTDTQIVGQDAALDVSGATVTVQATNLDIRDLTSASDSVAVLQATASNLNATVVGTGTFAAQVTGSVTANAGTNLNTSALNLEATQSSVLTAVQLIDDPVATLGTTTYTETTTKGMIVGAVRRDADTTLVDTTNEIGPLQMDANGRLKVEAFSGETLPVSLTSTTITGTVAVTQSGTWDEVGINDSGNAITVDWAGTAPPIGAGVEATALRVTVATDSTGVLSVDDNGGALTVDGTVTANAGTGTFTTTAVGTVADDATTPGAPQMIGGQAKNFDGTAPGNVSAEDDVAIAVFDRNRRQYVNIYHPEFFTYHESSSSQLTDTSVQAAPGANEALFITDFVYTTNSATASNCFIEEGATTILGPIYLEAIAGRGGGMHFSHPHRCTTNTAITVSTSAAIAHGIEINGFIARVD